MVEQLESTQTSSIEQDDPISPKSLLTKQHEIANSCFDCGNLSPDYISINNAVFICGDCAAIHESDLPEIIS